MNMTTYNDIGIENTLDWARIRKLMIIGVSGAILTFVGDFILGFRTGDESLTGLERKLSSYLSLEDWEIFLSAILGFIGIPLEGLCYFSIYRLIAPYSMKHAHLYRAGIFGYLIFGGCGVHVPCLACVFFYKYMAAARPETAFDDCIRFGLYFLLPGCVMLLKFAGNNALASALTAAWISIGNLWMFGGLLAMMKKAQQNYRAQ